MRRLLLMLLLLLPANASCSIIGSGSAGLPEVLVSNTCQPPCWFSITPGETTHKEVLSLLPELPFIEPETIQDWQEETGAHVKHKAGGSSIRFYYDAEQVVKVISVNTRARKLSLGELIPVYGNPDRVLVVQGMDSHPGLYYYLIYPQKGITFGGVLRPFDAREEQAVIKEDYLVIGFHFFNPELLEEVFTDFSISGLLAEVFQSGLQDWRGFGEIDPVDEFPSR